MEIKLNQASVQNVIDAGANHWVKGDFDRYYIDVKDLVEYDFYKTGNVRYAAINGEKISNTEGTSLLHTKIYVENGKLVSGSEDLINLAMAKYDLHEESEEVGAPAEDAVEATETVEESTYVEDTDSSNNDSNDTDTFKVLDTYLEKHGLTRYQISKRTGIGATTLQRSADMCATDINSRVMVAIAQALKKTPGQVFDELIELEMENDMTAEETKLLLIQTLDDADATALVTTDDMDGKTAVVAEIDLPSEDIIRFSVNTLSDKTITRYDVLNGLAYAMDDYDHEEDGLLYPTRHEEPQDIVAEYIGVTPQDSDYLGGLSNKIFKMRRG